MGERVGATYDVIFKVPNVNYFNVVPCTLYVIKHLRQSKMLVTFDR